MKPRDILLAIAVPLIWGGGFLFAKAAIDHFPPILLMALRFSLTALVLVWFVPRPDLDLAKRIFLVALVSAAIQYSLTFTGLKGRYRVLHKIHGTGPGIISGETIYREETDLAGLERVTYQYSPYLLESLMHLFAFYAALRQEDGDGQLIPAGMEEMRFTRRALDGERFTIGARQRHRDDQGVTWDAQAIDDSGAPVMQLVSMRMNRYGR